MTKLISYENDEYDGQGDDEIKINTTTRRNGSFKIVIKDPNTELTTIVDLKLSVNEIVKLHQHVFEQSEFALTAFHGEKN